MIPEHNRAIIRNLVGPMLDSTIEKIGNNVEMYLSNDLAIFIPYLDYCDYAITPQHTHPGYSFIYNFSTSGDVRVFETLKRSPFGNKANICAFSPDIPHEEIIEDQFHSYMAVCISKKFFEKQLALYSEIEPQQFEGDFFRDNELVLNGLKRFIVEHEENLPGKEPLLQSIALEITHLFIRHCHTITSSDEKISGKIEINRLINHLNEHFADKISVNEMARFINLSPSHFSRTFKDETGETPADFLINLRVQKAKKYLLHHDCTITDVAYNCGFSSSAYFTTCFTERAGATPSQFRKKYESA
ncbi:MAG: AraC family transcriptional regulator [Fibrobacterales bacterium]